MHDGLQALNTIVEESKTASEGVKKYCNDKYKELQDKLLYAEVYHFNTFKNFKKKNKTPGNDGLTAEFLFSVLVAFGRTSDPLL